MCGICGVFDHQGAREVGRQTLEQMNRTLSHRGPDDEGTYIAPGIGIAMSRLAVIDLPGGHQPITNEDESCWIVFNGEIYNYRHLAADLNARGHRLRTHSDTEVILHLYEEYGTECVNHLDGMFAFAIWDGRGAVDGPRSQHMGRLFLARDRTGKKPLYYTEVGGRLMFASEVKALLKHPDVAKVLDPDAIRQYLSLLVVPAPLSIFKSIKKLPPGHFLMFERGGAPRIERYWDFRQLVEPQPKAISAAGVVPKIRRLLFEAVEKRLIADVPVGAFLSGGLDSSTVVAIMSKLSSAPVKTFAIGFSGPEYFNELPYAAALARYYRTDHTELVAQPDILELLQELPYYSDEPFAIASAIPVYLLSKAARREVTVVLTGDGGDEVFGGYRSYLYETWAACFRAVPSSADRSLRAVLRAIQRSPGNRLGAVGDRLERFVTNARKSVVERKLDLRAGFRSEELTALGLKVETTTRSDTAAMMEEVIRGLQHLPPEVQLNVLDFMLLLPDEMLTKVDRMTMAASLEARSPLLDWKLVECLASVPWTVKVPGLRPGNVKALLRQAVEDLLPSHLLARRKHTFDVPLDHWFRGRARPFIHDVLGSNRVAKVGVVRPEGVSDVLARYDAGDITLTNRVYALVVFQLWAEATL